MEAVETQDFPSGKPLEHLNCHTGFDRINKVMKTFIAFAAFINKFLQGFTVGLFKPVLFAKIFNAPC